MKTRPLLGLGLCFLLQLSAAAETHSGNKSEQDEVEYVTSPFQSNVTAGIIRRQPNTKKNAEKKPCKLAIKTPASGARVERTFDVEVGFSSGKPEKCGAGLYAESGKYIGFCYERLINDEFSRLKCENVTKNERVQVRVECSGGGETCTTSVDVVGK